MQPSVQQIRAWNDDSISIELHCPLYNNFQYLGWIISNNLTVDEKFTMLHVSFGFALTSVNFLLQDKQRGVYIHLNRNWLFSASYKSVICIWHCRMHFYTRKILQCIKIIVYKFFIHGQNNHSTHVVHSKLCLCLGQSGWVINYLWANRRSVIAGSHEFLWLIFCTKYSITL